MYVHIYAPTTEPIASIVLTVWLRAWSGNIMKPGNQGTCQQNENSSLSSVDNRFNFYGHHKVSVTEMKTPP